MLTESLINLKHRHVFLRSGLIVLLTAQQAKFLVLYLHKKYSKVSWGEAELTARSHCHSKCPAHKLILFIFQPQMQWCAQGGGGAVVLEAKTRAKVRS